MMTNIFGIDYIISNNAQLKDLESIRCVPFLVVNRNLLAICILFVLTLFGVHKETCDRRHFFKQHPVLLI